MNTLKLLTSVKIYINTYICQALARYSSRSYCKGTGRVLLTCIILVSMFSLSAQTPRRDSGANGLKEIVPIEVNYYVPESFWNQQLKVYSMGDTSVIPMARFKRKPLIIDFWSISCASCITKFPKLYDMQQKFGADFRFLLVNKESRNQIHAMKNDFLRAHALPTIYDDRYLNALLPHRGVPHYVWITPAGRVAAITSAEFVDQQRVKAFIDYCFQYETPN